MKVIRLVRDPIARIVSTYLARLRNRASGDRSILSVDPAELARSFAFFDQHRAPVTGWYEHLRVPLAIDVFSKPFEPAVGTVWSSVRTSARS